MDRYTRRWAAILIILCVVLIILGTFVPDWIGISFYTYSHGLRGSCRGSSCGVFARNVTALSRHPDARYSNLNTRLRVTEAFVWISAASLILSIWILLTAFSRCYCLLLKRIIMPVTFLLVLSLISMIIAVSVFGSSFHLHTSHHSCPHALGCIYWGPAYIAAVVILILNLIPLILVGMAQTKFQCYASPLIAWAVFWMIILLIATVVIAFSDSWIYVGLPFSNQSDWITLGLFSGYWLGGRSFSSQYMYDLILSYATAGVVGLSASSTTLVATTPLATPLVLTPGGVFLPTTVAGFPIGAAGAIATTTTFQQTTVRFGAANTLQTPLCLPSAGALHSRFIAAIVFFILAFIVLIIAAVLFLLPECTVSTTVRATPLFIGAIFLLIAMAIAGGTFDSFIGCGGTSFCSAVMLTGPLTTSCDWGFSFYAALIATVLIWILTLYILAGMINRCIECGQCDACQEKCCPAPSGGPPCCTMTCCGKGCCVDDDCDVPTDCNGAKVNSCRCSACVAAVGTTTIAAPSACAVARPAGVVTACGAPVAVGRNNVIMLPTVRAGCAPSCPCVAVNAIPGRPVVPCPGPRMCPYANGANPGSVLTGPPLVAPPPVAAVNMPVRVVQPAAAPPANATTTTTNTTTTVTRTAVAPQQHQTSAEPKVVTTRTVVNPSGGGPSPSPISNRGAGGGAAASDPRTIGARSSSAAVDDPAVGSVARTVRTVLSGPGAGTSQILDGETGRVVVDATTPQEIAAFDARQQELQRRQQQLAAQSALLDAKARTLESILQQQQPHGQSNSPYATTNTAGGAFQQPPRLALDDGDDDVNSRAPFVRGGSSSSAAALGGDGGGGHGRRGLYESSSGYAGSMPPPRPGEGGSAAAPPQQSTSPSSAGGANHTDMTPLTAYLAQRR